MDSLHNPPAGLLCSWDFLGENIGVGCRFLLQRIFLTQGLNLHLPIAGRFFTDWAPVKPKPQHSTSYVWNGAENLNLDVYYILDPFIEP